MTNTVTPVKMLSALLGLQLNPPMDAGLQALNDFHKKYPDETHFDANGRCVIFSAEEMAFELKADTLDDLEPVFKLTVTTYLPTQVVFDSGWVPSPDEALEILIAEDFFGEEEDEDGDDEDGDDEDGDDEDGDDEDGEETNHA